MTKGQESILTELTRLKPSRALQKLEGREVYYGQYSNDPIVEEESEHIAQEEISLAYDFKQK